MDKNKVIEAQAEYIDYLEKHCEALSVILYKKNDIKPEKNEADHGVYLREKIRLASEI